MHRRIVAVIPACAHIVEDAGHKGNHHGHNGGADNHGEENLDDLVVLLEDANHAWLTTFSTYDFFACRNSVLKQSARPAARAQRTRTETQTRSTGQATSISSANTPAHRQTSPECLSLSSQLPKTTTLRELADLLGSG